MLTLTDLSRWSRRLLLDWLPLALLLVFYDQSASLVKALGTPVHTAVGVRFDELLFGKPLLTVQLQHLLGQTSAVSWWEYPMWGLYMTHFFLALVVAGLPVAVLIRALSQLPHADRDPEHVRLRHLRALSGGAALVSSPTASTQLP